MLPTGTSVVSDGINVGRGGHRSSTGAFGVLLDVQAIVSLARAAPGRARGIPGRMPGFSTRTAASARRVGRLGRPGDRPGTPRARAQRNTSDPPVSQQWRRSAWPAPTYAVNRRAELQVLWALT